MKLYFFNNQGIARNDPPPSIIKTIFGITFLLELTLFLQSSRNNPFQDHIRKDSPSSIIKTIKKEPPIFINQDHCRWNSSSSIARNDPPSLIIKTMLGITLDLEITLFLNSSNQEPEMTILYIWDHDNINKVRNTLINSLI